MHYLIAETFDRRSKHRVSKRNVVMVQNVTLRLKCSLKFTQPLKLSIHAVSLSLLSDLY